MAETNLTMNQDIDITVRAIDFVTSFKRQWDAFREITGIIRPIPKQPGTKLTMKRAHVDLQNGAVGEGELVPLSKATVEEIEYGTATIKKHKKKVSVEAITEKGYAAAVQMTDTELRNVVFDEIISELYRSMLTMSTLRSTEGSFQMALSMALGTATDRWKKMRKSSSGYVGFCNTLDLYRYYGSQPITIQTSEGVNYIKNFMGYSTLIISSEIPQGTVVATASENLVNYYINPSNADYSKSQLKYITDGESNLIGFNTRPDYDDVTTVADVMYGIYLFAEYPDGVALVTIDAAAAAKNADLSALSIGSLRLTPAFDPNVISYTATTTSATNTITATAADTGATVTIKNGTTTVESGSAATWAAGENTVTITVDNSPASRTYTVKVTKK